MIATGLSGPALVVLAFKKRNPETVKAPQFIALVGIVLLLGSLIVYMNASPESAVAGGTIEEKRVLLFTYILLPSSVAYAFWITYLDERASSLKDFTKALDSNGSKLRVDFPGGHR
jgi:hypothetical protein